jgi:hypothetical protein
MKGISNFKWQRANSKWFSKFQFGICHLADHLGTRGGEGNAASATVNRPSSIYMHPKMRNRRLSHHVGALHTDDVISGLGESVGSYSESVLGVFIDVAIGFDLGRCAVAE